MISKHRQGKLEGEFGSSSQVTWGFIPGPPSIDVHALFPGQLSMPKVYSQINLILIMVTLIKVL